MGSTSRDLSQGDIHEEMQRFSFNDVLYHSADNKEENNVSSTK